MRVSAFVFGAGALALAGCVSNTPNDLANIQYDEMLMASVYSLARPAEDVARDEERMPLETMRFARVAAGQRVLETAPGDGYYTRLLAQAVGQEGRVYVLVSPSDADATAAMQALAEQYGNVELVADPALIAPVDLVWAIVANESREAASYADGLRNGGTLYVESESLGNIVASADQAGLGLAGRQDRADPPVIGLRFEKQ